MGSVKMRLILIFLLLNILSLELEISGTQGSLRSTGRVSKSRNYARGRTQSLVQNRNNPSRFSSGNRQ